MRKKIPYDEIVDYINTSETWDDVRKWTRKDWFYFKRYLSYYGITGLKAFKVIRYLKKCSKAVID